MRVALLSIDPWQKLDGDYRPFNYPVRRIEAAIRTGFPDVELRVIDSRSTDVDAFVDQLEAIDPDLIGGSAYVWSFPTFLQVARRMKERRRDRLVVLGGPSARPEMFALPPYRGAEAHVDALVLGEGENVVREIVGGWLAGALDLRNVAGLALPTRDGFVRTAEAVVPMLDDLPSPFQMGLVPHGFTAHLETFRGCPLSCTFCQWGDLSKANRAFSTEYLVRELESFRRMGARGVSVVDAALNLNPKAFRNLVAADAEVRFLETAHFHTEIYPSHMTDDHLAFLERIGADSVGIGLQSYDREVLKRVGRPFDEKRFEKVVHDVAKIVPDPVVEIIVGLPGDDPDSFWRTFERVRQLPIGMRVYKCLVLPNALMSRAPAHFAMDFDPITLQMVSCWGWSESALRETCERLTRRVEDEQGEMLDGSDTWKFSAEGARPRRTAASSSVPEVAQDAELDALGAAVREGSRGAWRLLEVRRAGDALRLRTTSSAGELVIEARPSGAGPSFRVVRGIAFSYVSQPGRSLDAPTARCLTEVAERLVAPLTELLGPSRVSLPVVS